MKQPQPQQPNSAVLPMRPVRPPLCSLAACAALLMTTGSVCRAELNQESPFLPPASAAASAADAVALEFRGITVVGGETFFNLTDPATKKGTWVKMQQPGAQYVVKSHEAANGTNNITVDFHGRILQLALMKPKTGKTSVPSPAQLAASARPGPPPPPVGQAPQPQGAISPVVLNPTPADEARRLEDFRAEYQRRRLQRQQATQPQPAPQQRR